MTTTKLAQYKNGNCEVSVYSDGTKYRICDGVPMPEFPEAVDLKITDYCDAGCPWCHEKSTKRGSHAPVSRVREILLGLGRGTEVAIGGGNPLDHPDLEDILVEAKSLGLIANLTVNSRHVWDNREKIARLRGFGLIHGLGISYHDESMILVRHSGLIDNNTVIHFIAGLDSPQYAKHYRKILVLGYKRFGFGAKCDEEAVGDRLREWRYWLPSILSRRDRVVSFDNLALEQLKVCDLVGDLYWEEHFMGEDGVFTFYVDAVRDEWAVSSTKPRRARNGMSAREILLLIRNDRLANRNPTTVEGL